MLQTIVQISVDEGSCEQCNRSCTRNSVFDDLKSLHSIENSALAGSVSRRSIDVYFLIQFSGFSKKVVRAIT